jgi:selenide,water dikinase
MSNHAEPTKKNVVLVGAGHAHVLVLRDFGMNPLAGAQLTLISRGERTPYSGMLPGLIAGLYRFEDIHIDVEPLTRFAAAVFHNDEAVGLDLATKTVIRRGGPPLPYDLLSIDIGSTPNTSLVPGASEHAIPVKPIDGFLKRFEALLARTLQRQGRARVAVVGAGAGGVELLLAVERRLSREVARAGYDTSGLAFVLVSATAEILPVFPARFRACFGALLAERGVAIVTQAPVLRVEAGLLLFDDRAPIEADEILWATQAAPADWLAATDLPLDESGFLKVDQTLRVAGRNDVFAAGDVISFASRTLPKSGVYAVRAGPVLADNIRRAVTGLPLRAFRPQRDALYLVSTGGRSAIGARNGLTFGGAWVGWWKDWIDRRFMRKFKGLPNSP